MRVSLRRNVPGVPRRQNGAAGLALMLAIDEATRLGAAEFRESSDQFLRRQGPQFEIPHPGRIKAPPSASPCQRVVVVV